VHRASFDRRVINRSVRSARTARARALRGEYRDSASIYDAVYAWKDYRREAERCRALVRAYGPRNARSLLDVACGTGEHLRYLSRWYESVGLDANPRMLAVARRKLPHVRFLTGRMQSFRIPERFDVLTCLFSSIGYVRSVRELHQTLRNFARHLRPGGVALVEPWLTPAAHHTGLIHLATSGTGEEPIARMNDSRRRGDRSIMDMHYLVGASGRIRHWVERHELTLFDAPTMLRAFRSAGFHARRAESQFTPERGIYVAVRLPERTGARTARGGVR
jgi:ubiquinone/menaquinone biosynthesis C-methylase UbiE